jgi:hypothetical protein
MAKKTTINKAYVEKFMEESGYPEVGHFEEKSDLQKFYKHLSDEQLAGWIELEGLEFNPNESAPINRMRMCMAILYKNFPKEPSTKKESKYAKYSLEDLMTMAMENEVLFEDTDDERILRMRAIMALRVAKVID